MTAQQALDTLISKTSIMNDTCANLEDCLKDGKCRFKVDDNNDCEDYKIAKTLQELVDRATPMKPIKNGSLTKLDKFLGIQQSYTCPTCSNACLVKYAPNGRNENRYCYDCSQAIDWSEEDET